VLNPENRIQRAKSSDFLDERVPVVLQPAEFKTPGRAPRYGMTLAEEGYLCTAEND